LHAWAADRPIVDWQPRNAGDGTRHMVEEMLVGYVRDELMPDERMLVSAVLDSAVFLSALVAIVSCMAVIAWDHGVGSEAGAASGVPAALLIVSGAVFLVCSVGLALERLMTSRTMGFAAASRGVMAKSGLVPRRTVEILLAKVESIAVRQNILGRLLNFDTVAVTGTGGTRESLRVIADPTRARKQINQILEGQVQRRASPGSAEYTF
jgi:uncharacterized membrane protein YdbT with pleckstrin-like domain